MTVIETTDQLLAWFPGKRHTESRTCPGCGDDLQRVAIVQLAYVFTECDCKLVPAYAHLYEQLWHTACLLPLSRSPRDH